MHMHKTNYFDLCFAKVIFHLSHEQSFGEYRKVNLIPMPCNSFNNILIEFHVCDMIYFITLAKFYFVKKKLPWQHCCPKVFSCVSDKWQRINKTDTETWHLCRNSTRLSKFHSMYSVTFRKIWPTKYFITDDWITFRLLWHFVCLPLGHIYEIIQR